MSIAASEIIAAGNRLGVAPETILALIAEIDAKKVADRRAAATERQRRKRERGEPVEAAAPVEPVTQNDDVTHVTHVTRSCVTEPAPRARVVISNPPTEDSYIKNPPSEGKKGRDLSVAPPKGTRIADDWEPDEAGIVFATATLGSPQAAWREVEKFRDYWRSVPGPRGVKLDWLATWRNWIRRSAETAAQRAPPVQQSRGVRGPSAADLLRELDAGRSINGGDDPFASGDFGAGGGLRGGGDVSGGRVVDLRPARSGWT